jgi:hypothetical protein
MLSFYWRNEMKKILVLIVGLVSATAGYCEESEADRSAKQAQLDSQCEEARHKALVPGKQDVFQECLEKKKSVPLCKNEADKYNGARAGRGPLFYDLPECEIAFDYKKNQ